MFGLLFSDPSNYDLISQIWFQALIGFVFIAIAVGAYNVSGMNDFAFPCFFVGLAILVAAAEIWLSGGA